MEKPEKAISTPELHKKIQELIALYGGGHHPDLVEDIILN